ncbi:glutaminase a [Grosmannia clavigera kw1407]|uniref:Glutaminase a n=1 Tax=Grosmannia clavigera (strain kw1407 / UAMH 11150) TaxID=655863 RepID=F0XMB5_GROCL|nr:glutaminase a [Grosmannia clavigera kw1407]EFX01409.1 glutaminase a [Grosmannia clavigera kw1407]
MKLIRLITTLGLVVIAAASTLTPPVLPLIVRNPYLSTWLSSARKNPWEQWPIFWTGQSIGFSVMASVPATNSVYPLLGRPHDSLSREDKRFQVSKPEYLGASFDASTTNLTYLLPGPAHKDSWGASHRETLQLTLSFLSPITPTSTFRQSIPAAYLSVIVEGDFDVDIYVDLNGEWVSGDRGSHIKWELNESGRSAETDADTSSPSAPPIKTWKVVREVEQLFTEFADRAEWGTLYFSAPASVRHESGVSAGIRSEFARTGMLGNSNDNSFRRIMEDEPVFAFAKSFRLQENKTTTDSVLFTFALVQNPIVQYASARGLTYMRPLWASYLATPDALIQYHYGDFQTASKLARRYSEQLSKDAFESGSKEYEEIASLSARQVLGATEFSGTPDNPLLFLKEISSNGNSQTVDVIFPAFPFFLYTNPQWLAYLLEPLLEHQLSGQYPNDYSMHDLGYHFPNETGHDDGNDEYMPVEECGNMLIMGLALINAFKYDTTPAFGHSGSAEAATDMAGAAMFALNESQAVLMDACGLDRPWGMDNDASTGEVTMTGSKQAKEWAARSYKLWKQWTGYLVRESLVPRWQLSTDDFAGWLAYQTNLALKGIIGIRAMSDIADLLGENEDAKHYRNISDTYVTKWIEYGISRDGSHAKLAYDWYGSWTTLYNLFADSLLCFHIPEENSSSIGSPIHSSVFIPDRIYKAQSDWYHNVLQRYGLPLDSRHLYTKSDWEFFAAAITSRSTRAEILASVARWLNETDTDMPFTDLYDTEGTGGYPPGLTFKARPVVGGHFSFLALERACGGKAMQALDYLNADSKPPQLDVQALLDAEREPFLEVPEDEEEQQVDEL